ncbi:MAG: sugar phosphate isomerase/epimerase [Bryobacterales bacterium]|nr:sugar phosphate isomerase/epimerase [Bryobacterales bacterium]
MTRRELLMSAAAVAAPAFAAPRTRMGIATTSLMTARRPHDTYEFLEYCNGLGAGGIQASLSSLEPDYLKKLRARAEQLGMYIEVMADLPKQEDATAFERTIKAAKQVDAVCIRTAALGGRRYENFSKLSDWETFVTQSLAAIDRALPIVSVEKMPLAIENHKDWTAQELVALMKNKSSEYLGVCLDTGNNVALLDNPMDAIEMLAPYALSTHFKDMAVEPHADGFLLSEVPLGEGVIELKRAAAIIQRSHPKTRFTLEMITRNPLEVPCLTDKYWVTFPDRNGKYLADTLRMVRDSAARLQHLPHIDKQSGQALLQLEEENIKQSLHYARTQLGL